VRCWGRARRGRWSGGRGGRWHRGRGRGARGRRAGPTASPGVPRRARARLGDTHAPWYLDGNINTQVLDASANTKSGQGSGGEFKPGRTKCNCKQEKKLYRLERKKERRPKISKRQKANTKKKNGQKRFTHGANGHTQRGPDGVQQSVLQGGRGHLGQEMQGRRWSHGDTVRRQPTWPPAHSVLLYLLA